MGNKQTNGNTPTDTFDQQNRHISSPESKSSPPEHSQILERTTTHIEEGTTSSSTPSSAFSSSSSSSSPSPPRSPSPSAAAATTTTTKPPPPPAPSTANAAADNRHSASHKRATSVGELWEEAVEQIESAEATAVARAPNYIAGFVHPRLKKLEGGWKIACVVLIVNFLGVAVMMSYYMFFGCEAIRAFVDADWTDDEAYAFYVDGGAGYALCTSQVYAPIDGLINNSYYAWFNCHMPAIGCSEYGTKSVCPNRICDNDLRCHGATSITYVKCEDFWSAYPLAQGYIFLFWGCGLILGFLVHYGVRRMMCDQNARSLRSSILETLFVDGGDAEVEDRFRNLEQQMSLLIEERERERAAGGGGGDPDTRQLAAQLHDLEHDLEL